MSNLSNLLNPESSQERDLRLQKTRIESRSTSPSTSGTATETTVSEQNYYQNDLITKAHEPHENCPNTLDCLPDTSGRPQHTLPVILRCAILGSPKKRLTIREIYAAMERKYSYYKTAGPAWKQSVRHHLSLNRLFEREPRPVTEPGFGSYWTVNLSAPPGTKRPRKRGPRKEPAQVEPIRFETTIVSFDRKREKPRGTKDEISPVDLPLTTTLRPVDAQSFNSATVRAGNEYDDDEDEEMPWDDEPQPSEDEFESEEELAIHYDPRMNLPSTSSSSPYPHVSPAQPPQLPPARTVLYGAFSGYSTPEHPDATVHRLKMEVEGLKRQSSEALSASMRMSDQLSEAQSDAAKARAALRAAESRLEDEKRRRIEAEMAVDEETRRRMEAEETIRALQVQPRHSPSHSASLKPR